MLRRDYGEYRDAMRRMVNDVDPIALIKGGAPADEYDPEISELLKWRTVVTLERVHEVFQRAFEMPISDDDARRIAEGIGRVRENFGYAAGD
ncbi:hypothetical protein GCM10009623_01010 [Nocardioides aestuarii]|uniref:Uncharacterized protein n=1 Tax=Nocardioides aestuarii TaxID=252231 RepID=A0ABW4TKB2_9ACTN